VAVTIKAGLRAQEYATILADSDARYCIVSPGLADTIASVKRDAENLDTIVTTDTMEYRRLFSEKGTRPLDASPEDPAWLIYT
jgi:long-subunit acyl-CoA synthetase (AMP-forming)